MKDSRPLRIVIVGHVDHGKSTLIGRLLYDTDSLSADRSDAIRMKAGVGYEEEFAHVMDHLEEERTGAMTIDTAQAFFRFAGREIVVIDAPGHKEFARNMVTGASQAEAAVLIVDATDGVREQTCRHACFLAMLGIRKLVVLVNKMDLVEFSWTRCNEVVHDVVALLRDVGLRAGCFVPGSAKRGDNIVRPSEAMLWYKGPVLIKALEGLRDGQEPYDKPLHFPIQDVHSVDGKRLLLGRVASGWLERGQEIVFLPSGMRTRISAVNIFGEDRVYAEAGECIGLAVGDALSLDRGEVGCLFDEKLPAPVSRFAASVFWMAEEPCKTGELLLLRVSTQEVPCSVERIRRRMDSASLSVIEENSAQLADTEIGDVVIRTERPAVIEKFRDIPELGRLVLARNGDAVAGGVIAEANAGTS